MDGPQVCEYCGLIAPASARQLDLKGWMWLEPWTSEKVLGLEKPMAFCRPDHLTGEMSRRRLR